MAEPVVILFARAPRLGCVKRRLAAGIGAVPALRFYRNQLARILRQLKKFNAVIAITPDRARLRTRLPIIPQGHGDLGTRMAAAFRRFPRRPTILIGADIPGLGAQNLRAAIKALKSHDAVFGPATDGGYYLVGLGPRRPAKPFARVRWSTEHALADTLANVRHLRVATLCPLHDIDTAEDLKKYRHAYTLRRGQRIH